MPWLKRKDNLSPADAEVESDEAQVLANLDRVNAVYATGLMDSAPRPEFDELTKRAAERLDAPIALMTFVDGKRQFFAGRFDEEADPATPRETTLDVSYCKFVVLREAPFEVENALTDPTVKDYEAPISDGVRSYLGVPLRSDEGHVLGSFCVVDKKPRSWSPEEREELEGFAASAMDMAQAGRAHRTSD